MRKFKVTQAGNRLGEFEAETIIKLKVQLKSKVNLSVPKINKEIRKKVIVIEEIK